MNYKRIIPDAITSCNLLCGSMSVYMATQYEFEWAFLFILAGAFFDFFDGLSARLLKAPSPIGIQLDSLADDITFGLAPSMMLFCFSSPSWDGMLRRRLSWRLSRLFVWLNSTWMSVSTSRSSVWQLRPTLFFGAVYAACR